MSPSLRDVDNILTVDVEDWFHILEAAGGPARASWASLESRVEANTDRLLEIFDETGARATFFVVGWVAERHGPLVRRLVERGHEVASHSWWHEVVHRHDAASFAADVGAAKKRIEDLAGAPVRGFRAPGHSITHATAWAFDVLVEQGYEYDSSLCPGLSSHGGYPSPFEGPHRLRCSAGELAEIPSSTAAIAGRRVPYAGGGYLRLFPYALVRHCVRADNRAGRPANVYVHPREIDPDQPRLPLPWMRRFKYYVGLSTTEGKLRRLLGEHRFVPAGAWLDAHADVLRDRVLDVRAAAARPPARIATPPPDPRAVAV